METTERAPMLSDEEMDATLDYYDGETEFVYSRREIRDFYESKITSGELRVVKTIPRSEAKDHVLECHDDMGTAMDTGFAHYILFCPGCGAKITT